MKPNINFLDYSIKEFPSLCIIIAQLLLIGAFAKVANFLSLRLATGVWLAPVAVLVSGLIWWRFIATRSTRASTT